MTSFAPQRPLADYVVSRSSVGLAVEVIDRLSRWPARGPLAVTLDVAAGSPLPPTPPGSRQPDGLVRFVRDESMFSLAARKLPGPPKVPPAPPPPGPPPVRPVRVRVGDDERRLVPRRLALSPEVGAELPKPLWLRVVVSPGAAWDVPSRATAIRGTVSYASGARVRWARISVRDVASGAALGVVHGDDRGEFLFAFPSHAAFNGPLTELLEVELTVHARPANLAPNAATASDALWDVPIEPVVVPVTTPGPPQPVALVLEGTAVPADFTRVVTFTRQARLTRSTSLELVV
ncbi:MAG: hypothetical protein ACOZQL_40385 [Myxococcota bacterium]